jgi:hypothetical protein
MKHTKNARLLALARRGAEAQFRDLIQEAKLLVDLFPHLRDSYDGDALPLDFIMQRASGRLTKKALPKGRGVRAAASPRRTARR